ncbi:lysis protein [Pseudomonas chlororaphis]|uniref:lysis system i-spanin subunit Rz n=1 Tax=Pseudomonas chlororaphis TaxID=587753 RepID=UPI001E58B9B9|nr:lysis system i-spanin subunit Rz [Pseudomonas chlororaphis]MCB2254440.1 lysis protein [Pseudomonas chlororaphis]
MGQHLLDVSGVRLLPVFDLAGLQVDVQDQVVAVVLAREEVGDVPFVTAHLVTLGVLQAGGERVANQSHYQELTNAQKDQARLRNRLAISDLRLSVLLDAADTASGCNVPATATPGGLVHGAPRARLDPAHAQRIVGITDDGDQGLIALRACQAYINDNNKNNY